MIGGEHGQDMKRCEQCGREGTRAFKTLGGFDTPMGYAVPITVCSDTRACRRRWPKNDERENE